MNCYFKKITLVYLCEEFESVYFDKKKTRVVLLKRSIIYCPFKTRQEQILFTEFLFFKYSAIYNLPIHKIFCIIIYIVQIPLQVTIGF